MSLHAKKKKSSWENPKGAMRLWEQEVCIIKRADHNNQQAKIILFSWRVRLRVYASTFGASNKMIQICVSRPLNLDGGKHHAVR